MEDLYTANAEEIGKDLIARGTRTYNKTDRNLPIITGHMQKMKFDSGVSLDVNKELEAKDEEIEKLKLDVERCSEQVYQVMRMNTNWQRYNDQREAKDQEKERERAIMIQQIKFLKEHVAMSEQKIMDMKSVYKSMSEDSVLRAENNDLRKQLEIKEAENRRLKADLQRNRSEEDKTRIECLQQQVNVYVEDFRKEREDREAIQAKYDSTRSELLDAQRTIDMLKMVYKQEGASYPYVTRSKQNKDFDVGMRPLGVEFHRQATDRYNASGLPDEVEVDCEENANDDSLLNAKKEEKLQCPACFKEFSFKEHHLLVEHIDTCS